MPDAWAFPSSKGTTTYEVVRQSDGSLTCNCPGWVFKKKDAIRECKHTRLVQAGNPGTFSRVGLAGASPTPPVRGGKTDLDRAMGNTNTTPAPAVVSKGRKFTDD